jgi:D-glycero-D-manno-heptose 1,7-bisphosphate phosphatase
MMLDIARRYAVEPSQVPLVSDTVRDLQAAAAAGCPPHLVLSGRAADLEEATLARMVAQVPATRVHASLGAFADWLLKEEHVPDSGAGALGP